MVRGLGIKVIPMRLVDGESSILIKKDLSISLAPSWPKASAFVSYCRRRCALPGQGEREPARRKLKSLDHEQGRDLNEMEMNLAAARAFGLQGVSSPDAFRNEFDCSYDAINRSFDEGSAGRTST